MPRHSQESGASSCLALVKEPTHFAPSTANQNVTVITSSEFLEPVLIESKKDMRIITTQTNRFYSQTSKRVLIWLR